MSPKKTTLSMHLEYDHGLGELTAYFDALREGKALGSRCPSCGKVSVPPRFSCADDGAATEPHPLKGVGRIAGITHTRSTLPFADAAGDHAFVLIAMDCADNLMFGRMAVGHDDVEVGAMVRLAGCEGESPHPAQAAVFKKDTAS